MVYEFFSCSTNIPSGLSAYNPQKRVVYCLIKLIYSLALIHEERFSEICLLCKHSEVALFPFIPQEQQTTATNTSSAEDAIQTVSNMIFRNSDFGLTILTKNCNSTNTKPLCLNFYGT